MTIAESSGLSDKHVSDLRVANVQASTNETTEIERNNWQSRITDGYTLIDFPLLEAEIGSDDPIRLRLDGTLEDLAGNVAKIDLGYRWLRTDQHEADRFQTSLPPSQPETGQVFSAIGISANTGQEITVPLTPDGSNRVLIPVSERQYWPWYGDRYRVSKRIDEVDWISGRGKLTLPDNATTGDLLDVSGNVLLPLSIVPRTEGIRIYSDYEGRQRWIFTPEAGHGYTSDSGSISYRYRFLTQEESTFWQNSGQAPFFTQAETLTWDSVGDSDLVSEIGFRELQVAGPGGVSEPFRLSYAIPPIQQISALAPTGDAGTLWMSGEGEIRRVDVETMETIVLLQADGLLTGTDGVPNVWLDSDFAVEVLQLVPSAAVAHLIEPVPEVSVQDNAVYLIAWMLYGESSHRAWVIDPVDGRTVGFLHESITGGVNNSDYLPAAYNPDRNSWFRLRRDNSRWEERSATLGEGLVAEGTPTGIPLSVARDSGVKREWQQLYWNDSLQKVALVSGINVPITLFVNSNIAVFDFQSLEFEKVDAFSYRYPHTSLLVNDSFVSYFTDQEGSVIKRVDRAAVDQEIAPSPAMLTELVATAQAGLPAKSLVASANPGQLIEIRGSGLTEESKLEFYSRTNIDGLIHPSEAEWTEQRLRVAVHAVSDDGTSATVLVPKTAASGMVHLVDSDTEFELQVIPLIEQIKQPQRLDQKGVWIGDFQFLGFAGDRYRLLVDDKLVAGCVDGDLDGPCSRHAQLSTQRLIIQHSVELVTAGGSHRVTVQPEQVYVPWMINQYISATPTIGAAFEYDELESQEVLAGSYVNLTMKRPSAIPIDTNWSRSHAFELLVPYSDTGELRLHSHVYGHHVEGDEYCIALPIGFDGGWIVPTGTAIKNVAEAVGVGLQIDVVPTVVAATGDSTRANSNVLIHGVNLTDSRVLIDGIDVSVLPVADEAENGLQTFQFVIPNEVTDGQISLATPSVSAKLPTLSPWWIDGDMPVAEVGIPRFADLPSVNPKQEFQFLIDAPRTSESPDELLDIEFAELRRTSIGVSGDFSLTDAAAIDGKLTASYSSSQSLPMVFGTRDSQLLNLIPSVPSAFRVTQDRRGSDFRLSSADSTSAIYDPSDVRISWGDNEWEIDSREFRLRFEDWGSYGEEVEVTHFERIAGDNESLQLASSASFPSHTGLKFVVQTLDDVPSDPIYVSNEWGVFIVPVGVAATTIFSQSVAQYGTPADESLPSLNVGQNFSGDLDLGRPSFVTLSNGQEARVSASWYGARNSDSSFRYQVPRNAISGDVFFPLSPSSEFVQIVPRIWNYFTNLPGTYHLRFTGVDETSQLKIGSVEIPLTAEELSSGAIAFTFADPRFSELDENDLVNSIRVTSRGGTSAPVAYRIGDLR